MATKDQIVILENGRRFWNEWRKENHTKKIDLSKAKLINFDLQNIDFSYANLSDADLSNANLNKANLSDADLTNANLSNADLRDADLSNADLKGADLNHTDLRRAKLNYADLRTACLIGANLRKATLLSADLSEAVFEKAILIRANLSRANLSFANLKNAKLISADLKYAELSNADLYKADLNFADLSKARVFASLRDANLSHTNFSYANLAGADLRRARLMEAFLFFANFSSSNLSKASLFGADLSNATFSSANLNGAYFEAAKSLFTSFTNIDLSKTKKLDLIVHAGASTIGTNTLYKSKGKISEAFLRGCGLSDWEIESSKLYDPDLPNEERSRILYKIYDLQVRQAIQVSPLFISYSHEDSLFVDRMEQSLNEKGIRFWRDTHNMKAGRIERQIDDAIRLNSTVLVIFSKNSIKSDWVQHEVRVARKIEKETGKDVLCPIALDDSWKSTLWPERIMEQVLEYNVINFYEWKDNKKFEIMFSKLIDGLNLFYKKEDE